MTAVDTDTGEVLPELDDRLDLPNVVEALADAARRTGAVEKGDENKEQGFKFRGIERIIAAAGPAMTAAGVVPCPRVLSVERGTMPRGQKGAIWQHVTLTVAYRFYGPRRDYVEAVVVAEALDNADKATSKAMTMAYKGAVQQVLKIGDAATDPDATTPPEQYHEAPAADPRMSAANVEKAREKALGAGLTHDEIAEMVDTATGGRTDDLDEVHKDEVRALREAMAHIVARKQPAEDPGRPFEPAGETT